MDTDRGDLCDPWFRGACNFYQSIRLSRRVFGGIWPATDDRQAGMAAADPLTGAIASRADGAAVDQAGDIKLGVRAYTAARVARRTPTSDHLGTPAPAGDHSAQPDLPGVGRRPSAPEPLLRRGRARAQPRSAGEGGLRPARAAATTCRSRCARSATTSSYRGEYEGVYDYGPAEYRTAYQYYNPILVPRRLSGTQPRRRHGAAQRLRNVAVTAQPALPGLRRGRGRQALPALRPPDPRLGRDRRLPPARQHQPARQQLRRLPRPARRAARAARHAARQLPIGDDARAAVLRDVRRGLRRDRQRGRPSSPASRSARRGRCPTSCRAPRCSPPRRSRRPTSSTPAAACSSSSARRCRCIEEAHVRHRPLLHLPRHPGGADLRAGARTFRRFPLDHRRPGAGYLAAGGADGADTCRSPAPRRPSPFRPSGRATSASAASRSSAPSWPTSTTSRAGHPAQLDPFVYACSATLPACPQRPHRRQTASAPAARAPATRGTSSSASTPNQFIRWLNPNAVLLHHHAVLLQAPERRARRARPIPTPSAPTCPASRPLFNGEVLPVPAYNLLARSPRHRPTGRGGAGLRAQPRRPVPADAADRDAVLQRPGRAAESGVLLRLERLGGRAAAVTLSHAIRSASPQLQLPVRQRPAAATPASACCATATTCSSSSSTCCRAKRGGRQGAPL